MVVNFSRLVVQSRLVLKYENCWAWLPFPTVLLFHSEVVYLFLLASSFLIPLVLVLVLFFFISLSWFFLLFHGPVPLHRRLSTSWVCTLGPWWNFAREAGRWVSCPRDEKPAMHAFVWCGHIWVGFRPEKFNVFINVYLEACQRPRSTESSLVFDLH